MTIHSVSNDIQQRGLLALLLYSQRKCWEDCPGDWYFSHDHGRVLR
jgi:hypothetical protein